LVAFRRVPCPRKIRSSKALVASSITRELMRMGPD
jgi:hypothetical protein